MIFFFFNKTWKLKPAYYFFMHVSDQESPSVYIE